MNTLDDVLIALAVLALVLYRQLRSSPPDERRMYTVPLLVQNLVVGLRVRRLGTAGPVSVVP
ncbi:hypothetical protein ACQPZP_31765 [Spirillospora sp. CA-142024]|uniref:hypothetical protein n=1 Tax=Spirillospora sp. CA-142024 TaxID=3240036 RepID=UPI003D8B257F